MNLNKTKFQSFSDSSKSNFKKFPSIFRSYPLFQLFFDFPRFSKKDVFTSPLTNLFSFLSVTESRVNRFSRFIIKEKRGSLFVFENYFKTQKFERESGFQKLLSTAILISHFEEGEEKKKRAPGLILWKNKGGFTVFILGFPTFLPKSLSKTEKRITLENLTFELVSSNVFYKKKRKKPKKNHRGKFIERINIISSLKESSPPPKKEEENYNV